MPTPIYSHSPMLGALLILLGVLALALASWIEVPMVPVPMTMQSYAIVVIGALYGWRLALATVAAYLGAALIGLPVFAGGASGPAHFVGRTAGYIFAFPVAAVLVGWSAERGWTRDPVRSTGAMLLGHAVILIPGTLWLSRSIGWQPAIDHGLTPFLAGAVVKSMLGAATVYLFARFGLRRR